MHSVAQVKMTINDPREQPAFERTPLEIIQDAKTAEGFRRDAVADALAQQHFGKRTIGDLEDVCDLRDARYAAVLALRRLNPLWVKAAQEETERITRAILRDECGSAISQLSPLVIGALAEMLVSRIAASYLGILEGTVKVSPQDYFGIVVKAVR